MFWKKVDKVTEKVENFLYYHISAIVVFAVVSAQDDEDPIGALEKTIPGFPGEDYPIFATPPETSFLCDGYIQGYYADPEAECQAFHICADFGTGDLTKYSLLCPNGTLFNQQYFICDWWFNVDCSQVQIFLILGCYKIKFFQSEDFYSLNEDVAAAAAAASEGGNGAATDLVTSYLPSYPSKL